jgi:hypothetical protein
MSQHDDQVYLKHMRDYAREAVDMLAGNYRHAKPLDSWL